MRFTVHHILLIAAVILFAVFAAIADGLYHSDKGFVFLGLGLAAFAGAFAAHILDRPRV